MMYLDIRCGEGLRQPRRATRQAWYDILLGMCFVGLIATHNNGHLLIFI